MSAYGAKRYLGNDYFRPKVYVCEVVEAAGGFGILDIITDRVVSGARLPILLISLARETHLRTIV